MESVAECRLIICRGGYYPPVLRYIFQREALEMRDTNRGVVHTQPNGKQRSAADFAVSIDWLEFTVCGVDRDVVVEQILPPPVWTN